MKKAAQPDACLLYTSYVPVTPLVYRQGGAVVSPSFQAKMTPISQDIFYNIDEWQ